MKEIKFDIFHNGDYSAGIREYSQVVTVRCEFGDFGGEEGEFIDFMKEVLLEWYDGANIALVSIDYDNSK